jgi:hypothetical protein
VPLWARQQKLKLRSLRSGRRRAGRLGQPSTRPPPFPCALQTLSICAARISCLKPRAHSASSYGRRRSALSSVVCRHCRQRQDPRTPGSPDGGERGRGGGGRKVHRPAPGLKGLYFEHAPPNPAGPPPAPAHPRLCAGRVRGQASLRTSQGAHPTHQAVTIIEKRHPRRAPGSGLGKRPRARAPISLAVSIYQYVFRPKSKPQL